jgi:tRNA-splicing ligase RtcB
MVHSGSRNIGLRIGDHFNELATEMNTRWLSGIPRVYPFLPTDTIEGQAYLAWLDFALRFAFFNRSLILEVVKECLTGVFDGIRFTTSELFECSDEILNIHHNYAALENHFGKNYWIHRKGATMAREGQIGIIPGSMGSASYITRGRGNIHSMQSCSHGAGRAWGRKDFNVANKDRTAEIEASLSHVVHSKFGIGKYGRDKGLPDVAESDGAYKSIEDVMTQQDDLVEKVIQLKPLVSVKG